MRPSHRFFTPRSNAYLHATLQWLWMSSTVIAPIPLPRPDSYLCTARRPQVIAFTPQGGGIVVSDKRVVFDRSTGIPRAPTLADELALQFKDNAGRIERLKAEVGVQLSFL